MDNNSINEPLVDVYVAFDDDKDSVHHLRVTKKQREIINRGELQYIMELIEQQSSLNSKNKGMTSSPSTEPGTSTTPSTSTATNTKSISPNDTARWSDASVRLLFSEFKDLHKSVKMGTISRKKAFMQVSDGLKLHDYNWDYEQCMRKWNKLEDKYKTLILQKKTSGNGASPTWFLFNDMHELLGERPEIDPERTASSTGAETAKTNADADTSPNSSKRVKMARKPLTSYLMTLQAEKAEQHKEKMELKKRALELKEAALKELMKANEILERSFSGSN